jgi:phosphoglycolate phosphatase-like HAD superfamily hydrolase
MRLNEMKLIRAIISGFTISALVLALTACAANPAAPDPLPSWNSGASKQRIIDFVAAVTDSNSSAYVTAAERVAAFDNDGTLWSEKPTYFQLLFIFRQVTLMAADHPEWRTTQPFQAVLENDWASLQAAGTDGLGKLAMATQAGMTTEEFAIMVDDWVANARHPTSGRPYTQMVYQPMLELIDYLKANEFKVYIVSGGGIEFMRAWTEATYGIPPEQVVGSSFETRYEVREGQPVIVHEPKMHFQNNKDTKPIAINRFIGRRPILAAGNSDGDFEMLEWSTGGDGARLGLLVHHTDAAREWAYDRESSEGRLDKGLNEANQKGWLIVDMARDWKVIYADGN